MLWLRVALLSLTVASTPAQLPATILTGRVVDENGAPLAGVAVHALRSDQPWITAELPPDQVVTTDVDGRWRLSQPVSAEPESHRLLFVTKGRVHVAAPLSAAGFPIVLPRGRTLVGRVVDPAGRPLAGVRVEQRDALRRMTYRAESARVAWPGEPRTAVRTDAAGRFVMPGTVDTGIQLVVGEAGARSYGPFAHGEPIEIVHRTTTKVLPDEHGYEFQVHRQRKGKRVVHGTTKGTLPIHGAGLCLWSAAAGESEPHKPTYGERQDYGHVIPIAADGTFQLEVDEPVSLHAGLLLPRPLQQGQPDLCGVGTIEVNADTKTLELDLRPHLPAMVSGRVRSSAPNGRLLVGVAVSRPRGSHAFGFASYSSPLVPVANDGSFTAFTPPGTATIFVIDLLTGALLHREAPRQIAASTKVEVALDVVVGAVDVALPAGDQLRWLELVVPRECWPHEIDDIDFSEHNYTKRIGCFPDPAATTCRLWLPPTTAEAWLVDPPLGQLQPRAKAEFTIDAGRTGSVSLTGN
ncbi:MAG: carboxypeptidase-like regulatory domain-containing protein [Planctomycetes bacterium]|jgi:hypothetical protein|nr:carboxypeptidase-like regulatory domain-containing protein [Planctomycetota bacterium]